MQNQQRSLTCPVCSKTEFSQDGSYEICAICGWENDPVQYDDPDFAGGANRMSLNDAKRTWAATHKRIG